MSKTLESKMMHVMMVKAESSEFVDATQQDDEEDTKRYEVFMGHG